MPQAIAQFILPPLITGLGNLSVPELMIAEHRWPAPSLAGKTRREIIEAVVQLSSATDRSRAQGRELVGKMLHLARMPQDRLSRLQASLPSPESINPVTPDMLAAGKALDAAQPGRFASLLEAGRPMHLAGACMGDLITEGEFVWTAPEAPIMPGDLVMVAVAGCIYMEAKIFLATFTRDGQRRAAFYQPSPAMVWDVPLSDVYHADRIAWVQRGAGLRPADAGTVLEPVRDVIAIHDGGALPKADSGGLLTGWDRALCGILAVLRAAPERREEAA